MKTPPTPPPKWVEGDRCQVSLPYGPDGLTVHAGHVGRVQEPGPSKPECTVKVIFDDPLVYGGMGAGWFSPRVLTAEGAEPALPER